MKWRRISTGIIALATFAAVSAVPASALTVPPAPSLRIPIVDQTSTLSEQQIQSLANQIAASRNEKSYQIGVLIIPTLGQDEFLEGYSLKVARQWGIGEKGVNNGVLFLVVKDDHKMRIEVGTGLEGDLTDTRASRILNQVVRPKFKAGDYYGGISASITSIQRAVSAEPDPALSQAAKQSAASSVSEGMGSVLFFGIGGLLWLTSMLARSKSWWAGGVVGGIIGFIIILIAGWAFWSIILIVLLTLGGLLLDYVVSTNYRQHKARGTLPSWWAGGGSVGGSGWSGGGGSFGGGGFSGGGSSGSW